MPVLTFQTKGGNDSCGFSRVVGEEQDPQQLLLLILALHYYHHHHHYYGYLRYLWIAALQHLAEATCKKRDTSG